MKRWSLPLILFALCATSLFPAQGQAAVVLGAGVEEGGLYRSRDGGDSWDRIETTWSEFGGNSDVHDIMILKQDDGSTGNRALTVIAL